MTHYFSDRPTTTSRPRTVTFDLDDRRAEMTVDAGVFSVDGLDRGTRVLLDEVPPPPIGRVTLADVGCGWGPVTAALALRSPAATVWAVDVDARALELCRANVDTLGVGDRVRTVTPTDVPDDLVLDGFWSNPPIRIGKAALHDLLTTWLGRLRPGATAHLVVHKHLGSDSLTRWLVANGWPTLRLVSRHGYRVLQVTAPEDVP